MSPHLHAVLEFAIGYFETHGKSMLNTVTLCRAASAWWPATFQPMVNKQLISATLSTPALRWQLSSKSLIV